MPPPAPSQRTGRQGAAPKQAQSSDEKKRARISTTVPQKPSLSSSKATDPPTTLSDRPAPIRSSLPKSKRPLEKAPPVPTASSDRRSLLKPFSLSRESPARESLLEKSYRSRRRNGNADADALTSQAMPPIPSTTLVTSKTAAPSATQQSHELPTLRRKAGFVKQERLDSRLGQSRQESQIPTMAQAIPRKANVPKIPSHPLLTSYASSVPPPQEPILVQRDTAGQLRLRTPLSEHSTTPALTWGSPSSQSEFSASSTTPTTSSPFTSHLALSPTSTTGGSALSPRSKLTKGWSVKPELHNLASETSNQPLKRVIPPELAHLAIEDAPNPTRGRPRRPSRDGVEDLMDLQPTPQVVTTHLRSPMQQYAYPTTGLSNGSADSNLAGGAKSLAARQGAGLPIPLRRSSSRPSPQLRPIDTSGSSKTKAKQGSREPSPTSASSMRSVFGFFSRKSKSAPVSTVDEKPPHSKKGPVAGTGHEGYGRYGAHRVSNGSAYSKRTSSGSGGSSDLEEFIRQKAAPVYLRNSDGQVVTSDSSATTLLGTRDSKVSSTVSGAPSQETMQSALSRHVGPSSLSIADSATSSRGRSSRGRGSWGYGSMSSDRPRKLTKSRKASSSPGTRELTKSSNTSHVELTPETQTTREPTESKISSLKHLFSRSPARSKLPGKAHDKPLGNRGGPPKAHYAIDFDEDDDEQARMEELDRDMSEAVNGHPHQPFVHANPARYDQRTPAAEEFQEVELTLAPELYREQTLRNNSSLNGESGRTIPRPGRLPQQNHPSHPASPPIGQRTLPERSFSRPFSSPQPRPSVTQESPVEVLGVNAAKPSLEAHWTLPTSSAEEEPSTREHIPNSAISEGSGISQSTPVQPPPEFLRIRKDSNQSYSSSSGSFYFATAPAIAVVPSRGDAPSPDEVWDEYNDIIGVMRPGVRSSNTARVASSTDSERFSTRSKTVPMVASGAKIKTTFPKLSELAPSSRDSEELQPSLSPFNGVGKKSPDFGGVQHPVFRSPFEASTTSVKCLDDTKLVRRSSSTNRRSRIPTGPLPKIPFAGSSHSSRAGTNASVSSSSSSINDRGITRRRKDSAVDGLKLAALNASKWLTFGRLLVSPAQDLLETSDEKRVLIVDGIGQDWPRFCAENCPEADVWGLSPDPYQTSQPSPTPNFRHIRQTELDTSFPFPDNHFFTVVFRFPAATSEHNFRFALQECKRVLSPGGYLEAVLLDLDLTNMGPKARRAVKNLKIRMQANSPDVCLKSASDHVQYLVGLNGFENLNRCFVGVPVYGQIHGSPPQSRDDSQTALAKFVTQSPDIQSDEDMTKVVAKVGRWWYSQCYEKKLLAASDPAVRSIWDDPALLRECKDSSTMLKLFVCYAQNPVVNKRKTQSL